MSSQKYASLILLAYKRNELLRRSLQSLRANTPKSEIIVVDDGSRDESWTTLYQQLRLGHISTLIMNGGPNRGVGEGIKRGFAVAGGDYLCKLDADLTFRRGWLDVGIAILEAYPDCGMVGFFDYHSYVPDDPRFQVLETRPLPGDVLGLNRVLFEGVKVKIVDDFVGSAFLLRRETYREFGEMDSGSTAFAEDFVYKQRLIKAGLRLAIPSRDFVENMGFGLGRSTVVVADDKGEATVTKISTEPYLV